MTATPQQPVGWPMADVVATDEFLRRHPARPRPVDDIWIAAG